MNTRGLTLIELIASLLILSVSMMGFYAMLSTLVEFSFQPEKILQAINHVEVYQQKINALHLPNDCRKPSDFKPLLEHWCGNDKHQPFTFVFKNVYQPSQSVHLESVPYSSNANLVLLQITLKEDNKLLYSTKVLRGIHASR